MSRTEPVPGCLELAFAEAYALGEFAEVALEDYARVLAGAGAAEALADPADPSAVRGVHVCQAAPQAPLDDLRADLEGFARALAAHRGPASLGWE